MFFSKKLSKFKKISHGFFNRSGGKSSGIYKSLNCGPGSKDKKNKIKQNLKIVRNKINKNAGKIFLVNQIHRKYVDLNRPLAHACSVNCLPSKAHYYAFHHKLSETITKIKNLHGKCLIFDVHGNKHSKDMLQLGYHINLRDLRNNKLSHHSFVSLNNIDERLLPNYIYKKYSLSNYFQPYLKTQNITVFPTENNIKTQKFDGIKYKLATAPVILHCTKLLL